MSDKNQPKKSDQPKHEEGHKHHNAHHTASSGVDGIGGAGGSSGSGGVLAPNPRTVGDISGVDAQLDADEVPAPGSTGKGGPASERQTEAKGGLPGKTRGNDSETEPSQSDGS